MATKGFGVSELNVDGDGITAIESSGSLLIESNNGMTLRSINGTVMIEDSSNSAQGIKGVGYIAGINAFLN